MYRRTEDFLNDWKHEEANTVKLFSYLKDDLKSKKINDDVRSLEKLAWHITQTVTELPSKAGLMDLDLLHQKTPPSTISEMIETYKKHSDNLLSSVKERVSDKDLEKEVDMYGQNWTIGATLQILIGHQTHHRGQMTAIMRMLGMPVPGLFGPSKEEWVNMGMPVLE